ncbi:MAG: hypothetical protein Q9161_000210 [Pseudevernia consocians]
MFVHQIATSAFQFHVLSAIALTASLPVLRVHPPASMPAQPPNSTMLLADNTSLLNSSSSSSSSSSKCVLPLSSRFQKKTPPLTDVTTISVSNLPTDPLFSEIPRTSLLLKFHNYGPRLPLNPIYRTLQTAVEDVRLHISHDPATGNVPMLPVFPGYVYGAGDVRLLLRPQKVMTWGMWGDTLTGLRLFGESWEFVGLEFDVWDRGEGKGADAVGSGHLWLIG